ncbi:MAG: hypothetical protein V4757_07040 [Pseudomonadota bacterium]
MAIPIGLLWRAGAALALAAALAAGCAWLSGRLIEHGEAKVQARWDADIAQRTASALEASEQARAKEQALQATNRRISHAFAKEQSRRAAADLAAADSLQRLNAALAGGGAGSADPAAAPGVDGDPRNGIIAQCASALIRMDKAVGILAAQTSALQEYAGSVCVRP